MTQLFGITNRYAFGEFTFDTSLDDPTVTVRLIDEHRELVYEQVIARSTLTPG